MPPLDLPAATDSRNFDSIDPLDGRYFDAEIAQQLSERSRIAYQAYVEAALGQTLADFGVCSQQTADAIAVASREISAEEVYKEEQTTKHDIKAVVNSIKSRLNDGDKPYVHFGATSYDIIMTASALQLRATLQQLVVPRLRSVIETLISLTEQHAGTIQIGRTHGQHGVPVTFGFAMAEYVSRLGSNVVALDALSKELCGKFSGAVGAYNALSLFVDDPQSFEAALLAKLDLQPAPYSNQIIPADATVRIIDELVISAGIMANLSHDMRHLQRTEIAEVRERFEPGQTGSSTMAHKRNPWNFENIISMSKQVTAQAVNASLNLSSEHQRDLTDSASSRFYAVAFASVASMAQRLNAVMSKLEIDEQSMQRNLNLTGGAIAAEPLYLLLEKYGHTAAHEASKDLAHAALENQQTLFEAAEASDAIRDYWQQFSDTEKAIIRDPAALYTGRAADKARQVAEHWRQQLAELNNV